MQQLFQTLSQLLKEGKDVVLVSIVASSGSVPRGSGARMLVAEQGRVFGTIGGGAVEYRSEQRALELLKTRDSSYEKFRLYRNEVEDLGMVCGGEVEVYFQFLSSADRRIPELLEKTEIIFRNREQAWLITELSGTGEMSVFGKQSGLLGAKIPKSVLAGLAVRPVLVVAEGKRYYCERLYQPGTVYIFGGGHIAQALAPMLHAVDFPCTVLDDRPDFVRPELFPTAETCLIQPEDISEIAKKLSENDYVCIMTRGHKDDLNIQRQVMRTPVRYIGVIGSAKKQKAVKERILELGYTEEDFANVVSPIGLDIGADTPAEIAVSITAQLIMARAGKGVGPKDWKAEIGPTFSREEKIYG